MSDDANKKLEEFHRKCGEVLRIAVSLESNLEFFIFEYFIKPQSSKSFFFNDIILTKMSFERKRQVFEKVCEREEFDENEVKEIIGHILYVQQKRNRVAHWEGYSDGRKILLQDKKSRRTPEDRLELDDKEMERIEEHRLKAVKGIFKFHKKYHDDGTIDERDVEPQILK